MTKQGLRYFPFLRALLFLISISLSAIVLSCSASNRITKEPDPHSPCTASSRLFDDLYDLFSGKYEETNEQSPESSYYLIGNENIRLASSAENDEDKEMPLAYVSMTDMRGQPHIVSRVAAVDRDDIEVVYIEKSLYRGNEQYIIGLLFKQDSWDRVHDVTDRLRGKRLALLKGDNVLSVPVLHQTLVEAAAINGNFKKADIEWFVQGLTPTDPPSGEKRDRASLDWLERRAEKYPDDTSSIMDLAQRYFRKKESNCEKTSAIYERVIQLDPSGAAPYYLPFLHSCFKESSNFYKAITFYNKLIDQKKTSPLAELSIRMALAEAYSQNWNTHEALHELERALTVAESLPVSVPWLEASAHKDEIEKKLNNGKAKIVQSIEAAIRRVKSQELK